MNDTESLRDRLRGFTEQDAPPQRLDIDRVLSRGRRTRRVRRMAVAGAAAAVVAAGAGLTATALGPAGSPTSRLQTDASTAKYPDPLMESAQYRWLPSGYKVGWTFDRNPDGAFELDAGPTGGGLGRNVIRLQDFGKTAEPALGHLPGGVPAKRIPAEPVDGHRAYWIVAPTLAANAQQSFELRWEYAPGYWADLSGISVKASSSHVLANTVYKIAGSVRFMQRIQAPMPLRIKDLPAGLGSTRVTIGTTPYLESDLFFASGLAIGVTAGPGADKEPNSYKTAHLTHLTINGHQALEYGDLAKGSAGLYVYNVNGSLVSIEARGRSAAILHRAGGLVTLFKHMTIYGTDTGLWNTDPLG